MTVRSAAAGSPVRSSTQWTTTITATAASTNSSVASMLTPPILPAGGRAGSRRRGQALPQERGDLGPRLVGRVAGLLDVGAGQHGVLALPDAGRIAWGAESSGIARQP